MRILLLNVDSRWNLAIRRMYNYFSGEGHDVEMRDLGLSGYPHKRHVKVDAAGFDQVYVSNIFDSCLTNKEKRGKCIGNGWTVDVVAWIFASLKTEFGEDDDAWLL